jgi:hypothetical protein
MEEAAKFPDPRLSSMVVSGSTGVRGIKDLSINLDRPITVICGKAGVEKVPLLIFETCL